MVRFSNFINPGPVMASKKNFLSRPYPGLFLTRVSLESGTFVSTSAGEIVAMQGLMNMVFEVADLAVASPATVSRCGMVYVQVRRG